jgi:hypothetical protein
MAAMVADRKKRSLAAGDARPRVRDLGKPEADPVLPDLLDHLERLLVDRVVEEDLPDVLTAGRRAPSSGCARPSGGSR